jgi:hypothetical protein
LQEDGLLVIIRVLCVSLGVIECCFYSSHGFWQCVAVLDDVAQWWHHAGDVLAQQQAAAAVTAHSLFRLNAR